MNLTSASVPLAPARERAVLWLLACTQFTLILDFMVMMPLGPQIMSAFGISPAAFAAAVSAYSWCAGFSGFLLLLPKSPILLNAEKSKFTPACINIAASVSFFGWVAIYCSVIFFSLDCGACRLFIHFCLE